MEQGAAAEEHCVASISEGHETTCWGCGLRLRLASYAPIFKCGWCGAITNLNRILRKPDSVCFSWWRLVRDRFLVTVVLFFIILLICAGVWAVHPIVFSIGYSCGIFHSIITAILSITTLSNFCLAAFKSAGAPANILWGSYPVVGKDGLDNYTFCAYCAKPKPPRSHHCRSCRMCVLDMDHHCPFIGNCVGAANHRLFITFLVSVVIGCTYIFIISLYAGYHEWPPLNYRTRALTSFYSLSSTRIVNDIIAALASSALRLSARGLVLIYLAFGSLTVEIGISVLLWQQLSFIYEGNTYISHMSAQNVGRGEKSFQNLLHFFGCPHSVLMVLPNLASSGKLQATSSSKLL